MADLIGTGAFKVDRVRALDKLMHFQLPDPSLFPIPVVRCAVSSGASRILLKFSPGEVLAEFDGNPLTRADLQDPYGCLLEDHRPEGRPNRELATSLLTALRLNPKSITVESGSGPSRVRLTVRSPKDDSLEPAPSAESITRLRVRLAFLSLFSQNWEVLAVGGILKRCRGIPLELRFFKDVPLFPGRTPAEFDGGLSFSRGPLSGRLRPAARPNEPSCLLLYSCGVEAGHTWHSLPGLQVEGWLNDDGFALNASQTGAVRNERYDSALAVVGGLNDELLAASIRALTEALPEIAGPLMAGGRALALWNDRLHRGAGAEEPGGWARLAGWFPLGRISEEVEGKILAAAGITAWLRVGAQTRPAAAEAPLLLSTDGAPLSLRAIKEQRDRLGYVPASKTPFPGKKWPVQAVWLADLRDWAYLEKAFPGEIRDVTWTLAKIAGGREGWGQATGLGLIKPANALLAQKLEIPGLPGEIGLLEEPAAQSRVHLFFKGLACGFVDHPCGLRFTAVVECGEEGPVRGRLAEIEAAAVHLYRIEAETGRLPNAALRRHLADFLVYAFDKGPAFLNQNAWLHSVPLFRGPGVHYSLLDLRQRLDHGESFYVCAEPTAPPEVEDRAVQAPPNLGRDRLTRLFPQDRLLAAADLAKTWLLYKPSAIPAAAPFRDDDLGQAIAVLEQLGGLCDAPEHPARKPLLRAVLRFQRPGFGGPSGKEAGGEPRRAAHLGELLRNLPIFRTPGGAGGTLTWVSRRLSHQLTYCEPGPNSKKSKADLILSSDEIDIIKGLFPKRMAALTPVLESKPKSPAVPAPAPKIFPPEEAVIFRQGYFLGELEYHFALPAAWGPPTMSVSVDGKPASAGMLAQTLCWVGTIRIQRRGGEADDWPSPAAVQHLLAKFYRDFLEGQFPKLRGRDREIGAVHLMSLLIQSKRRSLELPGWRALIADLRRAPLFVNALGVTFGLEELAAGARPDGSIPYLPKRRKDNSAAAAGIPIIPRPDLAAKLLKDFDFKGKRLSRFRAPPAARPRPQPRPVAAIRPPAPRPAKAPVPAAPVPAAPAAAPSAPVSDPSSLARELLAAVERLGFILPDRAWLPEGPLRAQVLTSALSDEMKAAYLASLAGSGINRRRSDFTDWEEVRFQQTLARRLSEVSQNKK